MSTSVFLFRALQCFWSLNHKNNTFYLLSLLTVLDKVVPQNKTCFFFTPLPCLKVTLWDVTALDRCFDSYNGPNLVLKYNMEKKRLINIAADNRSSPFYALRDRQGNAIGVTACDIDGDGREEIYVLNTNNAFSGTVHAPPCTLAWPLPLCCLAACFPLRQSSRMQIKSLSHLGPYRTTGAFNQSEGASLAKRGAACLRLFEPL